MAFDPNATEAGSNQPGQTFYDPEYIHNQGEMESWIQRFWPNWHIDCRLGKGAFGRVYKISKQEMGFKTESAVKIIEIDESDFNSNGFYRDTESLEEKARAAYGEIERMKILSGEPNIVIINESRCEASADGKSYIIGIRMELLQGLLDRFAPMREDFPVNEAMRVARDICRALIACHKHSIYHRDVKPQNVFWCERTQVYKLGDLGASKQVGLGTKARTAIGTRDFAAPEVLLCKADEYSKSVDVYSLGVMLFYLLNKGVKPFMPLNGLGDENVADRMRYEGCAFPDPASGDTYIADLIRSATAGDPNHRFKTAEAFYKAINNWPGWAQA